MSMNPDLAWAIDDLKGRAPRIARYRRMYEGDHPSVVEGGKTLSPLMRDLLDDLADNLCDDVVDEPTDRLAVKGWTGTDGAGDVRLAQKATDAWDANRGAARFRRIVRDAWMAADGFAIVERDAQGRGRFYPQHPDQMAVRYAEDNPDELDLAAKIWPEGKRWRLNLYYGPTSPGGARLERYATKGTSPGGGLPEAKTFQPLEGQTEQGDPLAMEPRQWSGIPVFHFPAEEVGQYGRSALHDVIPLQNLLNKSIVDLVTAMEEAGLPGRWATGIQNALNEDGTERPLMRRTKSALEILNTPSTEAQFGQFATADLTQFLEVQQSWRLEIARKGYLPPHSVGLGDGQASGISLLVSEGRQIKRVKTAQRDMGWTLRHMMAYLLELETGVPVDASLLDVEWERPETRDDQAHWELLLLKRDLGVPDGQLLKEGGYDPEEVQTWMDDRAAARSGEGGGRGTPAGPGIEALMAGTGLGLTVGPSGPAGAPQPNLAG